jgi:hypothetical protein
MDPTGALLSKLAEAQHSPATVTMAFTAVGS